MKTENLEMMRYLEKSFNAKYRELKTDPEILHRRNAAPDHILALLEQQVETRLAEAGLTEEVLSQFYAKETVPAQKTKAEQFQAEEASSAVYAIVQSAFGLSQAKYKGFVYRAMEKPEAALLYLRKELQEQERIQIYKAKALTAKVLTMFLNVETAPSEKILTRLADYFQMDDAQRQDFFSKAISQYHFTTQEFCDYLQNNRHRNPLKGSRFWDVTNISNDTWNNLKDEGFRTSQKTLLKCAIALRLKEAEGKDFLHLVDSDFLTIQDLTVLTCLYCSSQDPAFHDPEMIQEIFDFWQVSSIYNFSAKSDLDD